MVVKWRLILVSIVIGQNSLSDAAFRRQQQLKLATIVLRPLLVVFGSVIFQTTIGLFIWLHNVSQIPITSSPLSNR